MKRSKIICLLLCMAILISFVSIIAYAHPGRTDSSGGHYDHSTGEYHYHGTPDNDKSSGSSSSNRKGSSSHGDNGMEAWEIVLTILIGVFLFLFIVVPFISFVIGKISSLFKPEQHPTDLQPPHDENEIAHSSSYDDNNQTLH